MNCRSYFLLGIILIASCDHEKKVRESESFAIGYWVPKKIEWLKPDSGDKRIDSIRRYANFSLLCFSDEQFDLINATNGYTIGDDSLVFESEPGVQLFRGKWNRQDTVIFIERELKFSMANPTGENSKVVSDTIWVREGKTELFFNGKAYVKTHQYDRESIDKIEAYRVSDRY